MLLIVPYFCLCADRIQPTHPLRSRFCRRDIGQIAVDRHIKNTPTTSNIDGYCSCVENFDWPEWVESYDYVNYSERHKSS